MARGEFELWTEDTPDVTVQPGVDIDVKIGLTEDLSGTTTISDLSGRTTSVETEVGNVRGSFAIADNSNVVTGAAGMSVGTNVEARIMGAAVQETVTLTVGSVGVPSFSDFVESLISGDFRGSAGDGLSMGGDTGIDNADLGGISGVGGRTGLDPDDSSWN